MTNEKIWNDLRSKITKVGIEYVYDTDTKPSETSRFLFQRALSMDKGLTVYEGPGD